MEWEIWPFLLNNCERPPETCERCGKYAPEADKFFEPGADARLCWDCDFKMRTFFSDVEDIADHWQPQRSSGTTLATSSPVTTGYCSFGYSRWCHIHSPIEPDWSNYFAPYRKLFCDNDPFKPPFDVFDPRDRYTDFVKSDTALSSSICSRTDTSSTTADQAAFARELAVNYHIANTPIQLAIMHAISNVSA
eukprot:g40747.t1